MDLDTVPLRELGEIDPMYPIVANALDEWRTHMRRFGGARDYHGIGLFLELLAAEGYRVTKIDPGPCLDELLTPPVDGDDR